MSRGLVLAKDALSKAIGAVPAGARAASLTHLRRALGALPSDLVEWLQLVNGCTKGGWALLGAGDESSSLSIPTVMARAWPHPEWVPIARDDFGNFYCLLTDRRHEDRHPVGYVEGTSGNAVEYVAASNLDTFVLLFIECLQQGSDAPIFDRDHVLARDPALARIGDLPLPWSSDP